MQKIAPYKLKEWTDATNAIKLAGEIAEEISPYLAAIDIFVETYNGYEEGGNQEAINKLIEAFIIEVAIPFLLEYEGMSALPAFALVLIIEYILHLFNW